MSNPWDSFLDNHALNAIARLILMQKSRDPGDERVETLCAKLGFGATQVTTALNELAIEGFARRRTMPGAGPGKPPHKVWSFAPFLPSCDPAFQEPCDSALQKSSKGAATRESSANGVISGSELDSQASPVSRVPAPARNLALYKEEQGSDQVENVKKDSLGEGGVGGEPRKPAPRGAVAYSEEFEAIWLAYGRKGAKKKAFPEWERARTREDPMVIVEALAKYVEATAADTTYRKDLERWLKYECWESALPTKPKPQPGAKGANGRTPTNFTPGTYTQEAILELERAEFAKHNDAYCRWDFSLTQEQVDRRRKEWGVPEPQGVECPRKRHEHD